MGELAERKNKDYLLQRDLENQQIAVNEYLRKMNERVSEDYSKLEGQNFDFKKILELKFHEIYQKYK